MTCPECNIGESCLVEDVGKRSLVTTRYLAVALDAPCDQDTGEAAHGDPIYVKRICLVRLQDSLARLDIGLGVRLQMIG